jgi:hypothetical protein
LLKILFSSENWYVRRKLQFIFPAKLATFFLAIINYEDKNWKIFLLKTANLLNVFEILLKFFLKMFLNLSRCESKKLWRKYKKKVSYFSVHRLIKFSFLKTPSNWKQTEKFTQLFSVEKNRRVFFMALRWLWFHDNITFESRRKPEKVRKSF